MGDSRHRAIVVIVPWLFPHTFLLVSPSREEAVLAACRSSTAREIQGYHEEYEPGDGNTPHQKSRR